MGSTRSTAITVRTVFRCVASRNRESRPAPGHRASGFGWLYGVGSLGYGWSSTQAAVHASNLGFRYGWLNPQNIDYRATGLQLRCLQEHPEGVLLGFSQPNLNRACQARKFVLGRGAARHSNRAASTPGRGRRCEASRLAQPKARPGFPYDGRRHPQAEGRYFSLRSSDLRWRQPRNCSAAPLPRIMIFVRAPYFAGRRQRDFAKKSPTFECRAAPRPARGGGDSRDPTGRSYSTCRTATNPSRESSARRPSPRGAPRLGAEAGDAKHRDLLSQTSPPNTRPGSPHDGRCLQRPEKLQLARLSPHTAASKRRAADATPGGRPQYAAPRDEIAPPLAAAEKLLCPTVIDRAPGKILPFQLIVETEYFPFKAWRAGAARHSKQAVSTPDKGRPP